MGGFRFTAKDIAARLGVTGFVKNLPNGSVEVICEGTRDRITTFLGDINDRMSGYITDYKLEKDPAAGEFSSFDIMF